MNPLPLLPGTPARRGALLLFLAALQIAGCKPKASGPSTPNGSATASPEAAQSAATPRIAARPVPAEIWKEFSGDKAFEHVKNQVDVGPRPSGSAEAEKARALITQALTASGWQVERQEFTDPTPRGPVKFVNLIARFPLPGAGKVSLTSQQAIVCSHFDTKRFSTIRFIGASDGASSTGALLELARVLALDPALASKIELAFFDGEEAFVQFTDPAGTGPLDGLFGSRFYAKSLRDSKRAAQFKFAILWDMIGDKDLTITLSPDSAQPLTQEILASAAALGLREQFTYFDRSILDDHDSLIRFARIPAVDLIDFDYLPWHTADDTLDKLSPESLRKIGALTLFHLHKVLGR